MVDGLGETKLVDLGLETTFQQLLGGQLKDGIEFELVIGQKTVSAHTAKQSSSLEDALRILRVKCEQSTSGLSELGKSILNTPDFALAAESVLSDKAQFTIQSLLLVRSARGFEIFRI